MSKGNPEQDYTPPDLASESALALDVRLNRIEHHAFRAYSFAQSASSSADSAGRELDHANMRLGKLTAMLNSALGWFTFVIVFATVAQTAFLLLTWWMSSPTPSGYAQGLCVGAAEGRGLHAGWSADGACVIGAVHPLPSNSRPSDPQPTHPAYPAEEAP